MSCAESLGIHVVGDTCNRSLPRIAYDVETCVSMD